jgi:hypothetical protein
LFDQAQSRFSGVGLEGDNVGEERLGSGQADSGVPVGRGAELAELERFLVDALGSDYAAKFPDGRRLPGEQGVADAHHKLADVAASTAPDSSLAPRVSETSAARQRV